MWVQEWIRWSRENVSHLGEIPPVTISALELNVPWQGQVFIHELSQDEKLVANLLDDFSEQLLRRPPDYAARFTALHLYYSFVHQDPYPLHEDMVSGTRASLRRDLNVLVGLLPVDECPTDWRTIKWETATASAIGDWSRARELLTLAEKQKSLELADLWLIRATFNFLRFFHIELPFGFLPAVLGPKQGVEEILLFASALHVDGQEPGNDSVQDELRDTINDLEKALSRSVAVSPAYSAMLARCYFELLDFRNAARCYEELLKGNTVLEGLDWKIYLAAARSHRNAGNSEEARQFLEKCVAHSAARRAGLFELSELHAQEARYEKAYETLREAVELDPALEDSLAIRIALALGGVGGSSEHQELRELSQRVGIDLMMVADALQQADYYLSQAGAFDAKSAASLIRSSIEDTHKALVRRLEELGKQPYLGEGKEGARRAYLRGTGFIDAAEEKAISAIYSLVSEDAIHPLVVRRGTVLFLRTIAYRWVLLLVQRLHENKGGSAMAQCSQSPSS